MTKLTKRSLSWLLVLTLCVSLLSGLTLPVSATGLTVSTWKANWGTRGDVADALSADAIAFYQSGIPTYGEMAEYSGASDLDAVPESDLYNVLHDVMLSKHTYQTTYDDTSGRSGNGPENNMYRYTDCENGDISSISSFYSGISVGPNWDSGGTWNREHTWPQSKGMSHNDPDGADIAVLRPTAKSENGSRGNTAYGESSGFYDPNSVSGGTYNLHGDVARVILYAYVRWGNTDYMWGSSGVMESKEILLKWIAEDPVDTWELGRNDSVESITGTRNVFVDYPELAYLLFNEEIPEDLVTPSRGVDAEAVSVTFLENGTCTNSKNTYEGYSFILPGAVTTEVEGYTFVGWVDTAVAETASRPATVYAPGDNYTAPAGGATLYALYTTFEKAEGAAENTYTLTDALAGGEKAVIYNAGNGMAVPATLLKGAYLAGVAVTPTENTVVTEDASIVWTVTKNEDGTYGFANGSSILSINCDATQSTSVTLDGANPKLALESTGTGNGSYYIYGYGLEGKRGNVYLEWYAKYSDFSAYSTAQPAEDNFGFQFYVMQGTAYYTTSITPPVVTYMVSFSVPGVVDAVADMECGPDGITLPTAGAPEGYSFAGWVTEPVAETEIKPSGILSGTYYTEADVTLYALYTAGDAAWHLVTDDSTLCAGDKLLVAYNAGSVVAADFPSGKTFLGYTAATFSEDMSIATAVSDDALIFTLGGESGAWTLETASGTLAVTSAKNGKLAWSATNNTWTIAITEGNATIQNTWSSGRPEELCYNANVGQERFANYKPTSGMKVPQLYRLSGAAVYTTEFASSYLPGDINGDGAVNNKDVTRLFQYLSGYDVEVVEAALNVNGDGSVNNKDLTRLFQYLSGYDVVIH